MAKPRIKPVNGAYTADSFVNFLASVGRGTGNQNDGAHYGFSPISRLRIQLEYAYRSSWVSGRVVDCVAKDMTREGAQINSKDDPTQIAKLEKEIARLRVWDQLCETIKWARLYGGALAFLMIDGQDPSTPLRLETLKKGQFKGLLPMDRWVVNPSLEDLVSDYGPTFGKPKFYQTTPDTAGMPLLRIHHSRMLRFEGVPLPYWQRISENLWGQSVLERMWDRLIAFDSTTTGVAQLVYKAHLRTVSIENLREAIAMGGQAMAGISAQLNQIRTLQSNEGITLLDSKDKFETHAYTFTGLDAVLSSFGEQLAGATEIPLVRLFGQSPKGFGNGDADLENYFGQVSSTQTSMLADPVNIVYRIAYISLFGTETPEDFNIDFKPLWEPSQVDNSTIVNATTAAINTAYESQIISRATAAKELKQLSHKTGVFSNISDEDIAEAESDPPPSPEMLGLVEPEVPDPGQALPRNQNGPSRKDVH